MVHGSRAGDTVYRVNGTSQTFSAQTSTAPLNMAGYEEVNISTSSIGVDGIVWRRADKPDPARGREYVPGVALRRVCQ